jgi:hypothetical protein
MVSAAALSLGSAAAQGAPPAGTVGTLTMTPASGSDVLVPKVHTSAGCPTTADGYWAYVKGPGKFSDPVATKHPEGYLITSTTSVNMSTTAGFDVQLAVSMKDAATDLGTTLVAGEYDVTVSCVDIFAQTVKGTFTMAMYFTSPTAYQTTPPSTASPSASASASPSASASATRSATPSASDSASATPAPTSTPATGGTGGSLPITGAAAVLYAGVGALLLALGSVALAASDQRRRTELTEGGR